LVDALADVADIAGSNYGTFVPTYFRSRERKFHRWNFHSLGLSFPGTFVRWNFCSKSEM